MSLKIKDGKLYRDGVLVPLEFGNKEQIELIQQETAIINSFNDESTHVDVEIETSFTAKATYKCSCGQTVWFEAESDWDEDDAERDLIGSESKCRSCQKKYSIHKREDQFFIAPVPVKNHL